MPYLTAWIVIAGAALLGTVCLYVLTRPVPFAWLRALLRILPPVLLLVPAPVPGHAGNIAPAFVVFVFEALFQQEGQPGLALLVLLGSAGAVLGLVLLVHLRGRAARASADPASA